MVSRILSEGGFSRPSSQFTLRVLFLQVAYLTVGSAVGDVCRFQEDTNMGKYIPGKRQPAYDGKCPYVQHRFVKCKSGDFVWQPPENCSMPLPQTFLTYLKGRTIVFWGDSVNDQLSGAVMCTLLAHSSNSKIQKTGLHETKPRPREYCMAWGDRTRVCNSFSGKPRATKVNDTFIVGGQLLTSLTANDIIVSNFGVHYNSESVENLINDVSLLLASVRKYFRGTFIWREATSQHFPTPSGNFAKSVEKRSHQGCRSRTDAVPENYKLNTWRNEIANRIVQDASFSHLLRIGRLSYNTPPEMHRSKFDCTHFCNPGVPDDWAQILFAYILASGI